MRKRIQLDWLQQNNNEFKKKTHLKIIFNISDEFKICSLLKNSEVTQRLLTYLLLVGLINVIISCE